jgi:hypothetical protein
MTAREQCQKWEIETFYWHLDGKQGQPPKKPSGYDLWKQGPNPLGLASTKATSQPLVPIGKISTAVPTPLDTLPMHQPQLPL